MGVAPHEVAVLRANAAFYRAFNQGDFAAMSELWARRAEVACFHPAAPGLVGRAQVLESFRQILASSRGLHMRCDRAVVLGYGALAIVLCYEGNGELPAHLAATNVFALEDEQWRMVHHHAGPLEHPLDMPRQNRLAN